MPRVGRAAGRHPLLALVLVTGLLARAVLLPVTYGQDFVVWDRAAASTLNGIDIYAHHPAYPGGPYAYFPLFLYIELPLRWLAGHTPVSFTVLGKLPMVAADTALAGLLYREVRQRGHDEGTAVLAAAVVFLNPLVLYNSAYYGRFDSLGLALLVAGLRTGPARGGWPAAWLIALAVVMKSFPVFVLPSVLRRAGVRWWRTVLATVVVAAAVCGPYWHSLGALYRDVVLYDARKLPEGLSLQNGLLGHRSPAAARTLSYLFLLGFLVGTLLLAVTVEDLAVLAAMTFVLFVLTSKVVLDQYLVWPLPWLAITATAPRRVLRWASAVTLVTFSTLGVLINADIHPFGRAPRAGIAVLVAVGLAYLAVAAASRSRTAPS